MNQPITTQNTKPTPKANKRKSHMEWSWVIIVSFFLLSVLDFRFGILGFACMGAPMFHALRGHGKVHCSHYCPRGSFFGKILAYISLNNTLPKFMDTKKFRNFMLILMFTVFGFALYHAGLDFNKIAFTLFRFMLMSFIVGAVMGIFFKPRSWCKVCPMGHAAGLIKNAQDAKKKPAA